MMPGAGQEAGPDPRKSPARQTGSDSRAGRARWQDTLGSLGVARERSPLVVQILLFLLVTLLGVATGNVTKNTGALPYGLEFLRRESLPLAGLTNGCAESVVPLEVERCRAATGSGQALAGWPG